MLGSAHGRLSDEFGGLRHADSRLTSRVLKVVGGIERAPSESLPKQMVTEAELEGAYRLFANDDVSMGGLLAPHIERSVERCSGNPVVRVLHDTTTLRFDGEREGLGSLGGDARGFFLHVALATGADEAREPFGLLGVRTHINEEVWPSKKRSHSQRANACATKPRDQKSSSRWEKQALAVEKLVPDGTRAIHVMDQEADDYAMMATLLAHDCAFVIRASGDRRLEPGGPTIREALGGETPSLLRTVEVNPRTQKQLKRSRTRHPLRVEREATLSIRTGRIEIHRRQKMQSDAQTITVSAVHVFEASPPDGEEPIDWLLLTNEPVDTLQHATDVVDHYRARWLVEELFKALKTGCAFEKRQLTSLDSLERALGLFLPAAWHLLALRHLARSSPTRAATTLFTPDQLLLLGMMAARAGYVLSARPTLREAMLAIARLGGHLKSNGEPGWIVLGRGYEDFSKAQTIWNLPRPSDQS